MLIIEIIAVLCAFVIKGMCGFASTLIFGTILSFTTSSINITPLELLIGYPSNIFITWKERKGIAFRICIPLSILVILGIVPGMLFLKNGNTGILKILFGIVVILCGIDMLLREKNITVRKSSRLMLVSIGIASGICCGLFGVGAFLVAYVSRTTKNQQQFKSNLCFVFLIENTFRIILYACTGIITIEIMKHALLLLPFMFLGLLAGILLARRSGERFVRRTVIVLLILSGLSLIISNISF